MIFGRCYAGMASLSKEGCVGRVFREQNVIRLGWSITSDLSYSISDGRWRQRRFNFLVNACWTARASHSVNSAAFSFILGIEMNFSGENLVTAFTKCTSIEGKRLQHTHRTKNIDFFFEKQTPMITLPRLTSYQKIINHFQINNKIYKTYEKFIWFVNSFDYSKNFVSP